MGTSHFAGVRCLHQGLMFRTDDFAASTVNHCGNHCHNDNRTHSNGGGDKGRAGSLDMGFTMGVTGSQEEQVIRWLRAVL